MYLQAVNTFELQDKVLHCNEYNFGQIALELFQFQSRHNLVYSEFLDYLSIDPMNITNWMDIPFLPVETFKFREVKTGSWKEECVFESSGTTQEIGSKHFIRSLNWYHHRCLKSFEFHFGNIRQYEFFALLPHYLERKNSSLVEMLRYFMIASGQQFQDSFYQNDFEALYRRLSESDFSTKKPLLFGVSFALMDFAEKYKTNLENLIIIETGGMKGRRRELHKSQVMDVLKSSFPNAALYSEYGMAELQDQAYAFESGPYKAGPFLKFCTSDIANPLKTQDLGQRGLINIVDLGNVDSLAFIQTGDVGRVLPSGDLELFGRSDLSELRGCVQLYEQ